MREAIGSFLSIVASVIFIMLQPSMKLNFKVVPLSDRNLIYKNLIDPPERMVCVKHVSTAYLTKQMLWLGL